MLAVLGLAAWQVWQARRRAQISASQWNPINDDAAPPSREVSRWVIPVGACAGLLLAHFIGPLVGLGIEFERLAIIAVAGVVAWWLLASVGGRILRAEYFAVAIAAQCVHHLVAGGITYPGVAGSFWLLLALLTNVTQPMGDISAPGARLPVPAAWLLRIVALVVMFVAAGACYLTGYGPVLRCHAAMLAAANAREADGSVDKSLLAAMAADPLSAQAVHPWAEYQLAWWLRGPTEAARRRFDAAVKAMLYLEPHANSAWREAGQWYAMIYDKTRDPADALDAAQHFEQAVKLYPNNADLQADLAEAWRAADRPDEARRAAAEACRLDALTPHLDKKLSDSQRARMQEIAVGPR